MSMNTQHGRRLLPVFAADSAAAVGIASPKYKLPPSHSAFFHEGREALHEAAATNNVARVRSLLSRAPRGGRAAAMLRDGSGRTALHWAAERGSAPCVALLMAHHSGAAKTQDDMGRTPVALAAKEGHASAIAAILDALAGAPLDVASAVNATDALGISPIGHANRRGEQGAAAALLLLGCGAESDAASAFAKVRAASAACRWRLAVRRRRTRRSSLAKAHAATAAMAAARAIAMAGKMPSGGAEVTNALARQKSGGLARTKSGGSGLARQKSGGVIKKSGSGVLRLASLEAAVAEAALEQAWGGKAE